LAGSIRVRIGLKLLITTKAFLKGARMTPFELNVHSRLVALEHLLQNLYYMHYRAIRSNSDYIADHHDNLLATVRSDLRQASPASTNLDAMLIADEVEKQLSKNLAAVRSMWETPPRASA
jgi:hypothetical protein